MDSQLELVELMVKEPDSCMSILSTVVVDSGVNPRVPFRLECCSQCKKTCESKLWRAENNIVQTLSTGHLCTPDCNRTFLESKRVWLFDVAAHLGHVETLCVLPSYCTDIVCIPGSGDCADSNDRDSSLTVPAPSGAGIDPKQNGESVTAHQQPNSNSNNAQRQATNATQGASGSTPAASSDSGQDTDINARLRLLRKQYHISHQKLDDTYREEDTDSEEEDLFGAMFNDDGGNDDSFNPHGKTCSVAKPYTWQPSSKSELTAICRHTSTSNCSERREIVTSAVKRYVQRAAFGHSVDVEKIVEMLKTQPCNEDVIATFSALLALPEVAEGTTDLRHFAATFAGVQGVHSKETLLMGACRHGNERLMDQLLRTPGVANINTIDLHGMTALQHLYTVYDEQYERRYPEIQLDMNHLQDDPHEEVRQWTQRVLFRKKLARIMKGFGAKFADQLNTVTGVGSGVSDCSEAVDWADSKPVGGIPRIETAADTTFQDDHSACSSDHTGEETSLTNSESTSQSLVTPPDWQDSSGEETKCCASLAGNLYCTCTALKREMQVRLCRLAWELNPDPKELETLSALFDKEIHFEFKYLKGSCQRFLFPELAASYSFSPLVPFYTSEQDNEELFEAVLSGHWAADPKLFNKHFYSRCTFLPACAAAAAGNVKLLRIMMNKYVHRVQGETTKVRQTKPKSV